MQVFLENVLEHVLYLLQFGILLIVLRELHHVLKEILDARIGGTVRENGASHVTGIQTLISIVVLRH